MEEAPEGFSFIEDEEDDKFIGGMETALSMGTGAIAQPIAGIGGILSGMDADVVRNVQEALTYQPRSATGKRWTGNVGDFFGGVIDKGGEAGEALAGNEGELVGRVGTELLLNFLPIGAGVKGAKALAAKRGAKPEITLPKPEGLATPEVDPNLELWKQRAIDTQQAAILEQHIKGQEPLYVNPRGQAMDQNALMAQEAAVQQRQADLQGVQAGMDQQVMQGSQDALPFASSPEQIAAMQNARTPQRDMFVEQMEQGPARPEPPPMAPEQPDLAQQYAADDAARQQQKQAEMEAMYQQRQQEVKDAEVQKKIDAVEDNLQQVEHQLRGERVPKGQRGGVDFEGISEGLKRIFGAGSTPKQVQVRNILQQKNMIPVDPEPAKIVAKALMEQDGGAISRNLESGATLAAMNRKSSLIGGVAQIVQNAVKRADLYTRQTIFPVEGQFRKLSTKEVAQLGEAMKWESLNRRALTSKELEASGMNLKQLEAYAGMRQMFRDTLAIQNKSRAELGLKPITEAEYYMSSRWRGDFRQPVYDAQGKLVWYLAANSKIGLNKQAASLKKQFPDLVIDPKKGHTVKAGGTKTDMQSLYSTMVDVLGRDDPAVLKIKDIVEADLATSAYGTAGQAKHFETKAGIRGFVGDRPGTNPRKEALEMFQEQVQYAKNAYKWSSMQEAGGKIKEILADPKLVADQPNNVQYVRDYYKSNLGMGEAKWVAAVENAVRDLGISPQVFANGVGNLKSFFILQKLGMSAGYTAANLLQSVNVLPHLANLAVKVGGNPIAAVAYGYPAGVAMAATHYLSSLGKRSPGIMDIPDNGFYKRAFQYAEDNGVTSRSIYDEAPIASSRGVVAGVGHVLGKTMTIPETFVRSVAFMTYAKMLESSKKFTNDMDVFQKAEELTNASMVDYRAGERPMVFDKLGTAGNMLNTLQTFPVNFYNQWRYFAKEASKGNVAPIMVAIALQGYLAGLSGIPFMQDIEKLINFGKDKLPTEVRAKVVDFDPRLWAIENLGEEAVYGKLSVDTDVGMTSRLTAPSVTDMSAAPGAPVMDAAKQIGSATSALMSPTNETKRAQALLNSAPVGLQGYLETGPLRDQTSSVNQKTGQRIYRKTSDLEDRKGQYIRTPEEEATRAMGLRSQKETLTRDVNFRIDRIDQSRKQLGVDIVKDYYSAVRRGDTGKAARLQRIYMSLNGGTPISDAVLENQLFEEFTTTLQRKAGKEAVNSILDYNRLKKITERDDN